MINGKLFSKITGIQPNIKMREVYCSFMIDYFLFLFFYINVKVFIDVNTRRIVYLQFYFLFSSYGSDPLPTCKLHRHSKTSNAISPFKFYVISSRLQLQGWYL